VRGYLLDTHVWFWYLVGSERLPQPLRERIDAAPGDCWLSAVSVWELGLLARRGRVEISGSYRAWVGAAFARLPLQEAPLTREVAIRSLEIDLGHRDPADHFLAATALTHELTLLTADARLAGQEWLRAFSGTGPASPAE
jgi:PIN domain nuclease of toxin-antitoxin system